jgi:amidase
MSAANMTDDPSDPDRRDLLRGALAGAALASLAAASCSSVRARGPGGAKTGFAVEETSLDALREAQERGETSSRRLVEAYLARIEALDRSGPKLNSVLEVDPDALAIADRLDQERASGRVRSPLHGIPIVVKDNLDTADRMRTSAGSLALADAPPPPRDAEVVRRLRAAGAIVLGKTNLSEWANFRSTRGTSGWSARGGLTRNPYALDRNTSGSSSGTAVAVAASLAAAGIGTETDGSIVSPSSIQGLVGIKPTVGLVSRAGIVPISSSQDTAGPMCRSVRDAALLLDAISGADPRDPATEARERGAEGRYASACDADAAARGLAGARIGVVRSLFNAGPDVDAIAEHALTALSAAGAVLVDPVDVPGLREIDGPELLVLLHEFKAGIEAYLATRGPSSPHKTLADLIRFNEENRAREMPYFGQELFLAAQEKGPLTSKPYLDALAKCRRLAREEGLERVLAEHRLDALIAPTGSPAWTTDVVNGDHYVGGSSTLAAVAGTPAITIPAGFVLGLPVGITLMGAAWSETKLVRLAWAFEQRTKARRAPGYRATIET